MKKILVILVIGIAFAFSIQASAKEPSDVIKWKLQACYPGVDLAYRLLPMFSNMVKEKSGGRLLITTFPADELVKVPDTLEAGSKGMVNMVYGVGAFWKGVIPEADIEFGLPLSWRDGYEAHSIFDAGLRDLMRQAYSEHGLHYLNEVPYANWILMLKKPVHKVQDFKGMKIRAIGAVEILLKKFGVTPTYITPPEVYSSLQLGIVDGCGFSSQAWSKMKFGEVCKYYLKPGLSFAVGGLLVNSKNWQALPDDLKNVVELSALHYTRVVSSAFIAEERLIETKLPKGTMLELSKEEVATMRKQAVEVWNEIGRKSPRCSKGVKIVSDYLAANGVIE
jgi:TRAP-type C4-dicarboxylate transport system substrate-binding protein